MLSALTKPLESLTAADLQELTQRRWPESENVEYKGELHRERPNQPDSWYSGGNISTQAKYKIFKELVAFANTAGGRLFLGVTETRDRPPCADAIQLVPRCCELAERLEQSIISSIDPPLTFFRVIGVQTQGDSGVVVAEVSRSYSGPTGRRTCSASPFDSAMPTPAILGPYSIGDRDAVMNLIVRDLLDASGVRLDWPKLEIDWVLGLGVRQWPRTRQSVFCGKPSDQFLTVSVKIDASTETLGGRWRESGPLLERFLRVTVRVKY